MIKIKRLDINFPSKYFIIFFIISITFLNFIIPPFQSPDDFNHFKRAYLLSEGKFILEKSDGYTGGLIDNGLLNYMALHGDIPFNKSQKYSTEIYNKSKEIKWQKNQETFSDLSNIAPYFPLTYTTQAFAIYLGKNLDTSIDKTYRLSRLLFITFVFFIFFIAQKIYPIPFLNVMILLLPMSVFLFGAAHPDILIWSLLILILSISNRLNTNFENKIQIKENIFYFFLVLIFLLVSNRAIYIFLYTLPILFFLKTKKLSWLLGISFFICLNILWIFLCELHHGPIRTDVETTNSISKLVDNFSIFTSSIITNLCDVGFYKFIIKSFIGQLGWLDTKLTDSIYCVYIIFLIYLHIQLKKYRPKINLLSYDKVLFFILITATALLYLLTFLKWNEVGTEKIRLQGRYFYPILFILFYMNKLKPIDELYKNQFLTHWTSFALFSATYSVVIYQVINRYYLH